jgi:predicted nucleotidyltransferase
VLERFVEAVRGEYGDEDLWGIWLYGSRARGEREHDESDLDVLVVTRERRGDEQLLPLMYRVFDELGIQDVLVDPRLRPLEWIEGRRRIESFFLREVDRDKIVLHGRG